MNHFEIEVFHENVVESGSSKNVVMEMKNKMDEIENDGHLGFGFSRSNWLPWIYGSVHKGF